jgi:hypothetical protein
MSKMHLTVISWNPAPLIISVGALKQTGASCWKRPSMHLGACDADVLHRRTDGRPGKNRPRPPVIMHGPQSRYCCVAKKWKLPAARVFSL